MLAGNCFELDFESQAAPHWAALTFSHWLGMAVEFAENSLQFQRLREGTFLGRAGRRVLLGFLPPGAKRFPLTPRGLPLCSLPPPAPPSLSGDWKGSKGPEALIEPNGLPSRLDVFAEREIKGWEIFPGGPDRVLQLRGGILPALGRAFQMLIGT